MMCVTCKTTKLQGLFYNLTKVDSNEILNFNLPFKDFNSVHFCSKLRLLRSFNIPKSSNFLSSSIKPSKKNQLQMHLSSMKTLQNSRLPKPWILELHLSTIHSSSITTKKPMDLGSTSKRDPTRTLLMIKNSFFGPQNLQELITLTNPPRQCR